MSDHDLTPPPDRTAPVSPGAAALQTSLASLIDESRLLRTDVHAAEDARRQAEDARRLATKVNVVLLALLVVLVGLLLVVGWQNRQLVGKVNRTNTTMADCTTPGGKCYEEGRARTGNAIGDIIRANIFMAQCARLYPDEVGPAYDRKLEACVYARLAKAAGQRQDTPAPTPAPSGR